MTSGISLTRRGHETQLLVAASGFVGTYAFSSLPIVSEMCDALTYVRMCILLTNRLLMIEDWTTGITKLQRLLHGSLTWTEKEWRETTGHGVALSQCDTN